MKTNPFKRHRFPPSIILLAVRWYCRYPLSYRDVRDLLAERGIHVDPATINRWVVKFRPMISLHIRKRHYPRLAPCAGTSMKPLFGYQSGGLGEMGPRALQRDAIEEANRVGRRKERDTRCKKPMMGIKQMVNVLI